MKDEFTDSKRFKEIANEIDALVDSELGGPRGDELVYARAFAKLLRKVEACDVQTDWLQAKLAAICSTESSEYAVKHFVYQWQHRAYELSA